jgi:hypothetical protein
MKNFFLPYMHQSKVLVSARLSQTAFFVEEAFGSSDWTRLQSQTSGAG